LFALPNGDVEKRLIISSKEMGILLPISRPRWPALLDPSVWTALSCWSVFDQAREAGDVQMSDHDEIQRSDLHAAKPAPICWPELGLVVVIGGLLIAAVLILG